MVNTDTLSKEAEERARIHSETAKITWQDLQRFFAQGYAIAVSHQIDLVVAYQMSCDNQAKLQVRMEANQVGPVSDTQALEWLQANALMWSVVVRPWVLVQAILQSPEHKRWYLTLAVVSVSQYSLLVGGVITPYRSQKCP